jgi:CO/xanthine dehydrogenase FAD-binding subunit
MSTSPFNLWTAHTLPQALQLRAEHRGATILAGGTDLMVKPNLLKDIINIWGCTGLSGIDSTEYGFRIGALSTWTEVRQATALPPALIECAATVGAQQIQNRGTVGGNIVNGSPAGDSLPMWLVLDAEFEVASTRGVRRIPAAEFWTGYRKNAMVDDELLVAVHIQPKSTDILHYRKVGTRMAQSISKVVLGARLRIADGRPIEARFAMGSIAATPVRLPTVEAAVLAGEGADAATHMAQDITPLDDIRSTSGYRLNVATRVVRSFLEQCLGA